MTQQQIDEIGNQIANEIVFDFDKQTNESVEILLFHAATLAIKKLLEKTTEGFMVVDEMGNDIEWTITPNEKMSIDQWCKKWAVSTPNHPENHRWDEWEKIGFKVVPVKILKS